MDTTIRKSNHGFNVRRWREWRNIKQDVLAEQIGVSQATLSAYEKKDRLDDEILVKLATVLNVPIQAFSLPADDAVINIVNYDNSTGNGIVNTLNQNPTFNPIDKVAELYERLLKAEQEKIAMLEKSIEKLERK